MNERRTYVDVVFFACLQFLFAFFALNDSASQGAIAAKRYVSIPVPSMIGSFVE
jgi:hypothetical protein